MNRAMKLKVSERVRKHTAEPQMEIFDLAIKFIETKQNGYTCTAIRSALTQNLMAETGAEDRYPIGEYADIVEDIYSMQWKGLWLGSDTSSTLPWWWNIIPGNDTSYTREQKIRALNFFKKMCLEEKTDNYDPAEDKANIKEWIILMWQSKEDQPIEVTELAVSRAIRKMHFIKTGSPLKTVNPAKVNRLVAELNKE